MCCIAVRSLVGGSVPLERHFAEFLFDLGLGVERRLLV